MWHHWSFLDTIRHSPTGEQSGGCPQISSTIIPTEAAGIYWPHQFLPMVCTQWRNILQPLNLLLSKSSLQDLTWTDSATSAFMAVKNVLADATLIVHPKPGVPTCMHLMQQWVLFCSSTSMESGCPWRTFHVH